MRGAVPGGEAAAGAADGRPGGAEGGQAAVVRLERVDGLAEELIKTIQDAQAQFHRERDAVVLEFEASRVQLHTEYSQRLFEVDRELQEVFEERDALHGDTASARSSDVVTVNAGGRLCTVKRETLCVCQGSFLAELFSGRWERQLQKDAQGNVFLDVDPAIFDLLLQFLRDKKIETPDRPAASPSVPREDLPHFQAVVDYLGLRPYVKVPGLGPDGWGAPAPAPTTPPPRAASAVATPAAEDPRGASILEAAGSFLASRLPAFAGGAALGGADAPAAAAAADAAGLGAGAAGAGGADAPPEGQPAKVVGWSQRFAHPAVRRGDTDAEVSRVLPRGAAVAVALVGDTSAQGVAAAVRSTRGFQSGVHYWEVQVQAGSDPSHVGLVSADWASVHAPVGCAPQSWGLASNGVVYACGERRAALPVTYGTGSTVGVLLELGAPGQRTADLFVDDRRFAGAFRDLPETVYPAVSNMRAPARYRLVCDADPPDVEGEPLPGAGPASAPAAGGPRRPAEDVAAVGPDDEVYLD